MTFLKQQTTEMKIKIEWYFTHSKTVTDILRITVYSKIICLLQATTL